MKSLRSRLSVVLSLFFMFFFAVVFYLIYVMYADFRKDMYYKRLKDKAVTTFQLLMDVEKVDHDLLREIDRNSLNSLFDEKVLIFESSRLIYSSIDDIDIKFDDELLNKIKADKEIGLTQGNNEVIGLYVERNGKGYMLLASAFDKYGKGKLRFLRDLLLVVYFIGLIVGLLGTYLFVAITIKPLEGLTKDLKSIDYKNMKVRLAYDRKVKEINQLAFGINQMMERLERSSSFQKDFIHYASHELRTPLAAMISITENALHNDDSQLQLKKAMQELFQQQKELVNITNSLLYLSDSRLAQEGLEFSPVRLDEIVFHSAEIMKNYFPDTKIEVELEDNTTSPDHFMIAGNEPLLMIAINNLLKNALQYSDDRSAKIKVTFAALERKVIFINKGLRISEPHLERIFTPFYRSGNSLGVKGSGLGLALVYQSAKLHNAEIRYSYKEGANIFELAFKSQNISLIGKSPTPQHIN